MDRVVIRMPYDNELFIPALSLVQDYAMQLVVQVKNRVRVANFYIVVEFQQEDHFFFQTLIPRFMHTVPPFDTPLLRENWDYIIDLRSTDCPLNMALTPQKHLTDVWGIMYGCSPKPIPEMGGMVMVKNRKKRYDIVIDKQAEDAEKLLDYVELNFPEANVAVLGLEGSHPARIVDTLADTKLYVAPRGQASYIAAMLDTALIEQYGTKYPTYFMHKKGMKNYKLLGGGTCPASLTWLAMEELWQTISDTKFPDGTLMAPLVSTVGNVAAK